MVKSTHLSSDRSCVVHDWLSDQACNIVSISEKRTKDGCKLRIARVCMHARHRSNPKSARMHATHRSDAQCLHACKTPVLPQHCRKGEQVAAQVDGCHWRRIEPHRQANQDPVLHHTCSQRKEASYNKLPLVDRCTHLLGRQRSLPTRGLSRSVRCGHRLPMHGRATSTK